ncbi:hypothetical protein V8F33_003539 [Rhypophila sp. PSN 637]
MSQIYVIHLHSPHSPQDLFSLLVLVETKASASSSTPLSPIRMHLFLLIFSLLTSLSPAILVSAYPIKADSVNCRSGPAKSFAVKQTYAKGKDISITCQTTGTSVKGNNIWDKTPDNCYVADYYVKTGKDGFITKKCEEASSTPKPSQPKKLPGPIKNDYPYKSSCSANKGIDPWNYLRCSCTSFVAWRVNKRLGIKFHNKWRGADWGNANECGG